MIRGKVSSARQLRLSELIKSIITEWFVKKAQNLILHNANISLTKVRISSDLKIAYCYVRTIDMDNYSNFNYSSIAATLPKKEILMNELSDNNHLIRKYISNNVRLKYLPEIKFFYDDSYEKLDAVMNVISNLNKSN